MRINVRRVAGLYGSGDEVAPSLHELRNVGTSAALVRPVVSKTGVVVIPAAGVAPDVNRLGHSGRAVVALPDLVRSWISLPARIGTGIPSQVLDGELQFRLVAPGAGVQIG